jgi:hypothetical protein
MDDTQLPVIPDGVRQGGPRGERERAGIGPLALKQTGTVEHAYQMLDLLRMMFQSSETSFARWQETLELAKKHRVFELVPPEKPYGSLQAMLKAELGVTIAKSKQIVVLRTAQERSAVAQPLREARRPTNDERANKVDVVNLMQGGNDADYLTARIARDRPDILERMKAGEYPSVRRAAMDAGIVKPTVTHGVSADAFARAARKHLTADQIEELVEMLEAAGLGFLERIT